MNDDFEMPGEYDSNVAAEEPAFELPEGFRELLGEWDEIAHSDDKESPEVFTFGDFLPRPQIDIEPDV